MRLSQIYIRKYGPLQKDLELGEGITVISGPNESGKSILVEALLKRLAATSVRNAVIDESPDGFVEVTTDQHTESITDDDSLTEFCEEVYNQSISTAELRNIFVVRAGDLQFSGGDFYSHITDKLTGQRVRDIDAVRSELIEAGRLTEGRLNISNKQGFNKASDQLDAAKSLKEKMTEYLEKATEENLDQAERDLIKCEQRITNLTDRIDELEAAKKDAERVEKYNRLNSLISDLRETIDRLEDMPTESELESLSDKLEEVTDRQARQSELETRATRGMTLAKWSLGGGVIVLLATIGVGIPIAGLFGAIIFVGVGAYFWRQSRQASRAQTKIETAQQRVLSDAQSAGFNVESIEALRQQLSQSTSEREDLEDKRIAKRSKLESVLDADPADESGLLKEAKTERERLDAAIDSEETISFEEGALKEAKDDLEAAKSERDEIEDQLETHQNQLEEFNKEAHQLKFSTFTGDPLELELTNLDSLRELQTRLSEFIDAIESNAEASRTAIDIFDAIQSEEQEQTAELFEEGSRATELFDEITDARYSTVTYDSDANQLIVEKTTGETFGPAELSDGTRDQLYFAIRVALGERLLEGTPGFFILDDAFVTSDSDRLESQADIIDTLATDGWQVIYLTSKEDAISTLGDRSDNDIQTLQPLE